jgi:hypothetical protein
VAPFPDLYRKLRDTVLATWMLSVPVFAIFPVAPPRLAGIGMLDTISESTGMALDSRFATALYNPLAAVPSLHAGFAFAVSVALVVALRRPAARWLAAAWTPIVGLSVVATGNHYLFDIAAGVAITLLGGLVALGMRRDASSAPRRARRRWPERPGRREAGARRVRPMPPETLRRAEAGIGLAVGTAATVSPRTTLRLFGISADAVTAQRRSAGGCSVYERPSSRAPRSGATIGSQSVSARAGADQAVFLHAHRSKSVPRRASLMAIATSGAIVALDLLARRAER